MATMMTKISDDLKKRVEKFPMINWSEIMRAAILQKVIEEETRLHQRDPGDISKAISIMQVLFRQSPRNSTEELRKWRKERK